MKNFIANTEKKLDAWAEKLEKIDVRYPADLVTGIICLVLSIVLMVIMPQQVVISEKDVVNGRAFPTMLCYLMMAMSVLLTGKELVKLAAKKPMEMKTVNLPCQAHGPVRGGRCVLCPCVPCLFPLQEEALLRHHPGHGCYHLGGIPVRAERTVLRRRF